MYPGSFSVPSRGEVDWGSPSPEGVWVVRHVAAPLAAGVTRLEVAHALGVSRRQVARALDELAEEIRGETD